ncbi:type I-E CRISPR-associated protein Cas7/Cse4/CasC [Streptomyces sp. NPDC006733]|uniref:type I-E CRISPR-associated protein Cas7/Cse4/CasC n=1 Tax=Streptomyces sp. NPDC006733 TaxID=3155460 RepID=UPI0033E5E2C1
MSTRTLRRRLYLDIHLVQSYPYSNLNRDRQNSPKIATYGGVTRARTSSQNGKRHARVAVEKALGIRAVRTRGVPQAVAGRLQDRGWSTDLALVAGQMLILAAGVKGLGIADTDGTNALLFLPHEALDVLADLADTHREAITREAAAFAAKEAKAVKKSARKPAAEQDLVPEADAEDAALGEGSPLAKHAADAVPKKEVLAVLQSRNASVAAFGRMLANEGDSTVAGAVQMAHSLSTHATTTQTDFFSAVDDLQEDAGVESGAGHMGDNRYTSATFYKYASLNVSELQDTLDGDLDTAREVTSAFLRAFVTAVLPAKSSGTAPFTVPHLVYVTVRTDRPVSLVGAYETAIPTSTDGYLPASLRALDAHAAAHHRFLGTDGRADHFYSGLTDTELPALGDRVDSLDAVVTRVLDTLAKEQA